MHCPTFFIQILNIIFKYIFIMSQTNILDSHNVANFNDYTTDKLYADLLPSEGFTIKYDRNDQYIAIGCYNGTRILLDNKQKKILQTVEDPHEQPVTSIKWRPNTSSKAKVLGVTNAAGHFDYLHVPSMKKLFSIEEKDNSIHCCDFSKTGQHFATAGKDCHIRIYDQNTKSISLDFGCAEWNSRGHSNRIFSIKYIDDNTIVSGGWDSVIHLWDTRQGKSVKSVFGPHVAGDSIDFANGELLIGCYAAKNQIQVWDYNKFELKQGISWTNAQDKVAYVYTSSFDKNRANCFIAGGCGINQVKLFHKQGGMYKVSTIISNLSGGCYSVDTNQKRSQFVFTTAKCGLFMYQQTGK